MRRSKAVLVQDKFLDEIFKDLFCVRDHAPMDPLWSFQGQSFLECFCGGAVVILALIWSQVPVMRPWEVEATSSLFGIIYQQSVRYYLTAVCSVLFNSSLFDIIYQQSVRYYLIAVCSVLFNSSLFGII